jgi:hypothetical protein
VHNGETVRRLCRIGAAVIGTASLVLLMLAPGAASASQTGTGQQTQSQLDICKPLLGCCYSQLLGGSYWTKTDSDNYPPPLDSADDQGADDFSLTQNCNVKGVTVFGGDSAAWYVPDSFNVTFYTDDKGSIGRVYAASSNDSYTYNYVDGEYYDTATIRLPAAIVLKGPATYWISVQANLPIRWDEWTWQGHSTITGAEAVWRNSGGGDGFCPTWTTVSTCFDTSLDYDFRISG